MNDESIHDYGINSLADYLNCEPQMVFEIYYELRIDDYSDLEQMADLRIASDKYEAALIAIERAQKILRSLSSFENGTLNITDSKLIQNIGSSVEELRSICTVRKNRIKNSQSFGGKNVKADAIAELVARIFIERKRTLSFGLITDGEGKPEPSTQFGKAVEQAMQIFHVFEKTKDGKLGDYANWRKPAERAWRLYTNTN